MKCFCPGCEGEAESRFPLVRDKKVVGEIPVCHRPKHVVWAGGECCRFEKMDEEEQDEYLRKLTEEE